MQASPDDIKEIKQLFMSLDANGDGTLTLDEIQKGLKGMDNAEQIMEMMKGADTDGSGEINYTEFIAATID